MRTALCISGNLRTFRTNTAPIDTIMRIGGNVDIFVHTWDVLGKRFAGKRDNIVFDPSTEKDETVTEKLVREFYGDKLVSVLVDHQYEAFWNQIGIIKKTQEVLDYEAGFRHPDNPVAIIPMAYSLYTCNLMRGLHESIEGIEYDWVIRFRPDVTFPNLGTLENLEKDVLYYYPHYNETRVSDRVAVASPEIMNVYCSFFKKLNDYFPLNAEPGHGAEWLMRHHLDVHGIKYRRLT